MHKIIRTLQIGSENNTIDPSASSGTLVYLNMLHLSIMNGQIKMLMKHFLSWVPIKKIKYSSAYTFYIIDPATDKEIGSLPDLGAKETKEAIDVAAEAFKSWSTTTGKERHDLLIKWFRLMMEHQQDLATILTWENGKTLTEAKGEVAYGASFFEWFAEEAVRTYGTVIPSHLPQQRFVTIKQPVGVVGIITPWSK